MKTKKTIFRNLLSLLLMFISASSIYAQDVIISKNELPKNAISFINQHFNNQNIGYIKKDNDLVSVDYDVKFDNGMKIEFDSKGNWKEVDGKHQKIPTGFISKNILNYINTQFPNTQIIKIEKSYLKQEVKISNGLELIFNSNGKFLRLDD